MGSIFESITSCSCLGSRPKYPIPYSFEFDAKAPPPSNQESFQSNFIRTSKYSLITFLPQALFLQFKRLSNVYFLIISILLSITIISPINPLTAWAPLIIVIGISMIREGYEDYQRYQSDRRQNYEEHANVLRDGQFKPVTWSEILVGDICQVESQQTFPADFLLLSSSSEGGAAYIETASLDGQKNLKPRNAHPQTAAFKTQESILKLSGGLECNIPDKDLHKFQGRLRLASGQLVTISGNKQLLYRGTKLKNTRMVFGLVVYTGRNTKIIMNSQSQSQKMSQIQIKVNYILGIILIIQVVLCLICAIGYSISRSKYQYTDTYIYWPSFSIALDSFLIFLTEFVLLNTMIPISLIVSMEIVKMFQKYFIEKDKLMYSQYRNKYVSVQTASLNEQLGQIQYVFSDKTGTLTLNVMEFKIAVIGTQLYGDLGIISDSKISKPQYKGFRDDGLKKMLSSGVGDSLLYQDIVVRNREGTDQLVFKKRRELAEEYFLLLGLAHQVVPKENKAGETIYQGPSPDEIALVDAAKIMEYEFLRSNQSETFIKVRGRERRYQLLQSFPFTSDRKRMSIIIRDPRDNRIKMFTKGADSIIKQRTSPNQGIILDNQLNCFSVVGLRTLLVAERIISEGQYQKFLKDVRELPQENKEKELQKLRDRLQTDLYIIGATAVLDKLQDDVPQTIRDLIRANIKVWMLTGDKMETAENIAKSCKLIQPGFETLKFSLPNDLPKVLETEPPQDQNRKQDVIKETTLRSLNGLVQRVEQLEKDGVQKALLIEGSDLTHVLKNEESKKLLARLAKNCEAVVCCRLLPIQKAQVVGVVRQYLNKITLAIGDGANDVPMIKTAHIGIGLFGQEGMGAVQASDYALPQFRMLWRLLFVHGRWNYIRISQMILYFFYKNMLLTMPQFIAAFFNGFSGQTIFDDIYITLYNLIFTAIPLLIRAVLQQDVNYVYKKETYYQEEPQITAKSLITQQGYLPDRYGINKYFYRLFPKVYFIGQENCIFNYKNYFLWMFEGALEAVLITIFCFYVLGNDSLRSSGLSTDYWLVGLTIYTSVIMVVTFKLATHTRFWSFCLIISILITSLGMYFAYMWISNYALSFEIEGTAWIFWTTGDTYFVVLYCICVILFLDGVVVFIDFKRGSYASKMREVIHEQQINNRYFYDEISLFITEGLTEQVGR